MKGVADVAVVGIPHVLFGEIPRAFVVKQTDVNINEESILNYVEQNVVAYKKLVGGVKFVDLIPRNVSGKILRNELKVFGNNPSEQPKIWFHLKINKIIDILKITIQMYSIL